MNAEAFRLNAGVFRSGAARGSAGEEGAELPGGLGLERGDEFLQSARTGKGAADDRGERSGHLRRADLHGAKLAAPDFGGHRARRHDGDATLDLDRPLHGLDVVELRRVNHLHPGGAKVAVDHFPRRRVWLEGDETLARNLGKRDSLARGERMAGMADEDEIVLGEDLADETGPARRTRPFRRSAANGGIRH